MIKEYFKYHYVPYPKWDIELPKYTSQVDFTTAHTTLFTKLLNNKEIDYNKKTAVLLSGGLDSSTSAYLARHISKEAFTVVYPEYKTKDLRYAQEVADFLGYKLHIIEVLHYKTKREIPNIIKCFDKPTAESGMIPLYFAYKHIKDLGYEQVITGDGGDEVFLGYKWDKLAYFRKWIPEFEIKTHLYCNHLYIARCLSKALDIKISSPFIDEDIVKFAYSLPLHYKTTLFRDKIVLREAMRGKLPFVDRPKYYFRNPFSKWMGLKNRREIREWFLEKWIKSRT